MKDLRNPIERRNFTHPAGNTMTELKEAELNNFAAGAGEPRNSGGMFCIRHVLTASIVVVELIVQREVLDGRNMVHLWP